MYLLILFFTLKTVLPPRYKIKIDNHDSDDGRLQLHHRRILYATGAAKLDGLSVEKLMYGVFENYGYKFCTVRYN